jgi:hypothetical protein
MLVLDEQLLGRNLETEIGQWYQGAVRYIIDLRPNTIIKDDAIPKLLQQESSPCQPTPFFYIIPRRFGV